MNARLSWDEFWFLMALMYSTRGTCDRLRTATIIVKDKKLAGAGYNGSLPGTPHCDDAGHIVINNHCERALHGEQNAIINTSREDLKGSAAYILGTSCLRCFKELIAAGVVEVKCLGTYGNALGKEEIMNFARESNVKIEFFDFDPQELLDKAVVLLKRKGGRLHSDSQMELPV